MGLINRREAYTLMYIKAFKCNEIIRCFEKKEETLILFPIPARKFILRLTLNKHKIH